MATVLITGAQRPIGANLAVTLATAFDVVAVFEDGPAPRSGRNKGKSQPNSALRSLPGCQAVRVANAAETSDLIHGVEPQAVICCNSISHSAWSQSRIDPNRESVAICALAQAACRVEAHFTLVSSDAIFDRPQVFHAEDSPARSADAMWMQSLESAATEWGGLVLRTHPLAWGFGGESSFCEHMETSLANRTAFAVSPARYATPVLVDDFAEGWVRAYDAGLRGTLHLGGAERVSQLRLARMLANEMDESAALKKLIALTAPSGEPRETSLCSRAARKLLGWQPSSLADTVQEFVAQKTNGRWDALGRTASPLLQPQAA